GQFYRLHHLRLRLTDAHAADGVAVELQRDDGFGAFFAERGVAAALHDAENQLARSPGLFATFTRPAHRSFDGQALVLRGRVVRRAFIERHRDVRTERALNLHRFLRTEKQRRTVQM